MTDFEKQTDEELEIIIIRASELALLIRDHDITREYEESLKKIQHDRTAQEIISELIRMGEDLQSRAQKGEPLFIDQAAEKEMLRQKMEDNPLVKNHLITQKRYLNLMNLVLERIKNPQPGDLLTDI